MRVDVPFRFEFDQLFVIFTCSNEKHGSSYRMSYGKRGTTLCISIDFRQDNAVYTD